MGLQQYKSSTQENISVKIKLKESKQTSIKEWTLPGLVVMATTTTATTGVVVMLPITGEHQAIRILDIESGGMHTPLTGTKDMFGNRCMGPVVPGFCGQNTRSNPHA